MMLMRKTFTLAALMALAISVAGCGSFEKLTGMGRDDTVLAGQREDAIPGQASYPAASDMVKPGTVLGDDAQQAPDAAGQDVAAAEPAPEAATADKPCAPTDQKCKLAAKKAAEAAAQQSQNVFSDPLQ
jgi:hypothetical protein